MKVLTLKQPWATLLVLGYKGPETRSFKTKHRGRLLIHASAKFDKEHIALCKTYPFNIYIQKACLLPLGAIIGEVNIDSVQHTEDIRDTVSKTELAFGDYSTGRYAWNVSNCKQYPDPIPAKGALSLWDYIGPVPEMKGAAL